MALRPFGGRGFYDPYHEMNRMLDEMMGGTAGAARKSGRQQGAATEWAPAVDALTKDSDLVIRAELPGVKPEDVDISLHDNVLSISGERRVEQEEERGGYHIRERRYGSFRRSLALPEGIDESKISARYEDGVLEVRVQGGAVAREPKRIQIEAAGGQKGATDLEASEVVGREATTPTTETISPDEGTQGAAPPGDIPPETPPETRAR
jgi:HSP20 family protein